ncbi:MAG: Spy/CpxP family protein refolding chaperone [Pyrinomonadaceae bacterium]
MLQDFKYILLIALILLAGSLALTYGQTKTTSGNSSSQNDFPPPPPPDGFRRGPGPDPLERLNLTDEQREQIGLIKLTSRDASREQESKIRAADEQIRMYVDSGAFDIEKVKPLLKAKAEAMIAVELSRLAADAEINKLLTSEQKTQLAQLRDQRPPTPPGSGFGPPPAK